jgi:hypothetical protein
MGTPSPGIATNTGPLAAAAWLAELAIVPPVAKWFIEIELLEVGDPARGARFQLDVYSEEWGVQLCHDDRRSWVRMTDIAFVHGRDDFELLARIPRLATVGLLVRDIEQRFALCFDREAPRIHASFAEAEPVVRSWITTL